MLVVHSSGQKGTLPINKWFGIMVDISYNVNVNRGLITPLGPKWLFNYV
jgi:hypothetical protein